MLTGGEAKLAAASVGDDCRSAFRNADYGIDAAALAVQHHLYHAIGSFHAALDMLQRSHLRTHGKLPETRLERLDSRKALAHMDDTVASLGVVACAIVPAMLPKRAVVILHDQGDILAKPLQSLLRASHDEVCIDDVAHEVGLCLTAFV